MVAAARAGHAAGGHHRAADDDALGHHPGDGRGVARRRTARDGDGELRGVAASPGKAARPARASSPTPEQLHEVEPGEILVCRITAPSWAPVFSRIGGRGLRRRRDHGPHRDRLARVRAAGRRRHRLRHAADQDRPAHRGRRRHRRRPHPSRTARRPPHDRAATDRSGSTTTPRPAAGVLGGKFASLAEMTARRASPCPRASASRPTRYRALRRRHERLLERGSRAARAAPTPTTSRRSSAAARRSPRADRGGAAARRARGGDPRRLRGARATAPASPRLPVAVRSSGVAEDLAGASFAGQYDTFLWICGADAVLRARAPLLGGHVRRRGAHLPPGRRGWSTRRARRCASASSRWSPPRAAGVMFTLDPVTGDRSKIVHRGRLGPGRGRRQRRRHARPLPRGQGHARAARARDRATRRSSTGFDPASRRRCGCSPVEAERRGAAVPRRTRRSRALAALASRSSATAARRRTSSGRSTTSGDVHVLQVRPETVWSQRAARSAIAEPGERGIDRVLATFVPRGGPARGRPHVEHCERDH